MIVADTSPLNYLILIECDHLLPLLYGRITIPRGVLQELRHSATPKLVGNWIDSLPDWIDLAAPQSPPDPSLAFLDLGEREAIQIAEEHHATLLLIDERKGRTEAQRRGLRITGTLGVLLAAGELNLVNTKTAYRRLLKETPPRPGIRSGMGAATRRTPT